MDAINIAEKLSLFSDHWSPRVIGDVNDCQVKLAKLKGDFVWHSHAEEDEAFLVVSGRLTMRFRDRVVDLTEGQMIIVPRGVEHQPYAEEECAVMLIEPKSTLNTGDAEDSRTRRKLEAI